MLPFIIKAQIFDNLQHEKGGRINRSPSGKRRLIRLIGLPRIEDDEDPDISSTKCHALKHLTP